MLRNRLFSITALVARVNPEGLSQLALMAPHWDARRNARSKRDDVEDEDEVEVAPRWDARRNARSKRDDVEDEIEVEVEFEFEFVPLFSFFIMMISGICWMNFLASSPKAEIRESRKENATTQNSPKH